MLMNYEEVKQIYIQVTDRSDRYDVKGKTMPYTSANGHMFSQLNKDAQLGIRLSKEDGEQFKKEYDADVFKSYGAVMKGYVLIPESMLSDIELLSSFMDKAHEYVMSLEPK